MLTPLALEEHFQPTGRLGGAVFLGPLVPAARLGNVGHSPVDADLLEHIGVVGRGERQHRKRVAGFGCALQRYAKVSGWDNPSAARHRARRITTSSGNLSCCLRRKNWRLSVEFERSE